MGNSTEIQITDYDTKEKYSLTRGAWRALSEGDIIYIDKKQNYTYPHKAIIKKLLVHVNEDFTVCVLISVCLLL